VRNALIFEVFEWQDFVRPINAYSAQQKASGMPT
jgi:hypothetical protein